MHGHTNIFQNSDSLHTYLTKFTQFDWGNLSDEYDYFLVYDAV